MHLKILKARVLNDFNPIRPITVPTGLAMCLPFLYTLTLLFNLNIRRSLSRQTVVVSHSARVDAIAAGPDANIIPVKTGRSNWPNMSTGGASSYHAAESASTRLSVVSGIRISRTESQVVDTMDEYNDESVRSDRLQRDRSQTGARASYRAGGGLSGDALAGDADDKV